MTHWRPVPGYERERERDDLDLDLAMTAPALPPAERLTDWEPRLVVSGHRCVRCRDGEKPCVRGNPDGCEWRRLLMAKKMRHCWNCGAALGEIEDRHYDRSDVCGSRECNRAARDQAQEERDEAHRQLDEDRGWP